MEIVQHNMQIHPLVMSMEGKKGIEYRYYEEFIPRFSNFSFPYRYFSPGIYEQLLATKKFWDPRNKFNYCQSIGNDEKDCCPT